MMMEDHSHLLGAKWMVKARHGNDSHDKTKTFDDEIHRAPVPVEWMATILNGLVEHPRGAKTF
jgi:hypothetical protein